jgi:hypothetical protein
MRAFVNSFQWSGITVIETTGQRGAEEDHFGRVSSHHDSCTCIFLGKSSVKHVKYTLNAVSRSQPKCSS